MLPLQGQFEFDAARRQAFWNAVRAAIKGRSRTLLSYTDVIAAAGNEGQVDPRRSRHPPRNGARV